MKKMKFLLAGLAFASVLSIGALAVDTADMTYVANNEYYNEDTGQFVFTRDELNGAAVYSNIANGMVTTDPVSISVDNNLEMTLYTSGVELANVDFSEISDPGIYTLCVSAGGEMDYKIISFTIVRSVTGTVSDYIMPDGFAVQSVTLEGEPVDFVSDEVEFTTEGRYAVEYICASTGNLYSLDIRYDCTPPTLALEAVNEDGIARGPVSVADLEEGATLVVYRDGEQINTPSSGTLNTSGTYYLLVVDEAGNTTEYNFRIGVYLNFNAVIFIIILVAVLAALIIYLYRARKKMRTH